MNIPARNKSAAQKALTYLTTSLPVAIILLCAVLFGTSSYLHSQMLAFGQSQWSNYGMVRSDMKEPTCDADMDVDKEVEKRMERAEEEAEDSFLDYSPPNPDNLRNSLEKRVLRCQQKYDLYKYNQEVRQSKLTRF